LDNTQDKKRSLSDYFTQDVRATINLKGKLFKEISLVGQVNNVFNRLYESNGSTYPSFTYNGGSNTQVFTNGVSYFPMAGTNYMIGLNVKL
jgi:iron complex outermembrane receptor protein